jgi:hypothetical protein
MSSARERSALPTELPTEHASEDSWPTKTSTGWKGIHFCWALHVRLGPPNSTNTRQERRDQLRRNRATAQPLRAAFPAVQQVRIELRFEGPSASTPTSQSHVLYPPAPAFFEYSCPYADCDGQFDLSSAVKAVLADATRPADGVIECNGLRARDHASKQPCLLQLLYTVTATYQQKS